MDAPDYRHLAADVLLELAPRRLLAIGTEAAELAQAYSRRHTCEVTAVSAGDAEAFDTRYDLALLVGDWHRLDHASAATLLAKLRDVCARRILAALPADSSFDHRDMIGHGFTSLGRFGGFDGPLELFEYDIATYKTTPDWLNSRNWANPQHFDKYRW